MKNESNRALRDAFADRSPEKRESLWREPTESERAEADRRVREFGESPASGVTHTIPERPIRWVYYDPVRPRWWQLRRWYWYYRKPWKLQPYPTVRKFLSREEIERMYPGEGT